MTSHPDILDVMGILYLLLNYLVLLPFVLYSVHRYEQKSRNHSNSVITFRDKNLIYMINAMILISLLISGPLQLSYHVWMIFDDRTQYFSQILAMIVMDSIFILFTIKVYHLYFKHQYSLSIAERSWRADINPNDTNWYILRKNTFGNPMFLVKWSMMSYTIFIIIDMVLIFTNDEYTLIHVFITFSLLTIALITYWNIRTFDDAYKIRYEILLQFIAIGVGYVAELVVNSCTVCFGDARLQWLLATYISIFGLLPLSLSSLWYPLFLLNKTRLTLKLRQLSSSDTKNKDYDGFTKMKLTIADEQFFKSFMQFLIESLCTENLLFIVELIQIKLSFQEKNKNVIRITKYDVCMKEEHDEYITFDFNQNPKTNGKYAVLIRRDFSGCAIPDVESNDLIKNFDLCIPSNLPKTIILDKYDNLCDEMKALYYKYIKTGSDHELNLSYEMREKLVKFFEVTLPKISKDNEFLLYCILDEACFAILHLMHAPLQSFLITNRSVDTALNQIIGEEEGDDKFVETILGLEDTLRMQNKSIFLM